ncbi:MAG: hypothetical protein JST16_03855 [Bdellovibrionales bacterium]|nr:hypothetical protein [Bdellovibrionales bacterium]
MKGSGSERIILSEPAVKALEQMGASLEARGDCIRLTSSKLVSWIVERYLSNGFERDQEKIVQAHFDSRSFLKRAVTNASSNEDLVQALEATLSKLGATKRSINKSRPDEP